MYPNTIDDRKTGTTPRRPVQRSSRSRRHGIRLTAALICLCCASTKTGVAAANSDRPFSIRVVDAETGRGVPLVELRTTNQIRFVTDSNGFAAIDEPDLLETRCFFTVSSHGYEFPKDGFGFRGKAVDLKPGGEIVFEVARINIAERLYRVTGGGIYADSLQLGREPPIEQPLLNAQVSGQDSVQTAVYRGRIYWFWGDTSRPAYPLGHFGTAGAVSDLPADGGLDPSVGVNLSYFAGDDGFSRPMIELDRPGLVWIDACMTIDDDQGEERLVCHYARMKDLGTRLEHGLAVFNHESQRFETVTEFAKDERLYPQGQAFRVTHDGEGDYIYFATAFPMIRVRAHWNDLLDPTRYEAFTPLPHGAAHPESPVEFARDDQGRIHYDWRPDTSPVTPELEQQWIQAGRISQDEARLQTIDVGDGKPIRLHNGSVRWNDYLRRFVMIAVESYGEPSFLGEVYYSEADRPEGPWEKAVRIVTHDNYSFYNPNHHRFFDSDGGRLIYFEGTYSQTFSKARVPTPRYDYNQIMYRLDLDSDRLKPVQKASP